MFINACFKLVNFYITWHLCGINLYFFPSTETNKLRYKIQIIGQNIYVEAFLFEKVYEKFLFSLQNKKKIIYVCMYVRIYAWIAKLGYWWKNKHKKLKKEQNYVFSPNVMESIPSKHIKIQTNLTLKISQPKRKKQINTPPKLYDFLN